MGDIVERLSARIDATVNPIIAPHVGRKVFLLDVPDHPNVGDQAIFLGELAYFRRCFPDAEVVLASYSTFPSVAGSIRPNDLICLHGGGNFGDIWPQHHQFRLRVLDRFRDNVILQFPQSISFDGGGSLGATQKAIAACPNFSFLARDAKAEAFAAANFDCPVTLTPDMAFAMGPLTPQRARLDAVGLLRTDKEVLVEKGAEIAAALSAAGISHELVDWLDEDHLKMHLLVGMPRRLAKTGFSRMFSGYGNFAFRRYAHARLAAGVEILSRGETVITDRLHGQIIATLLGKTLFVFDSLDGKVAAFKRTWLGDDPRSTLVASVAELAEAIGRNATTTAARTAA